MINNDRLNQAYESDGIYALQLEVGDICHQGCLYCYMNALPQERNKLSDETIGSILEDSHRLGITAIEWLGGEPLLRNSIFEHMARAQDLGFRNNVWTGGLPLIDDHILRRTARCTRHGLIAVHVSTVSPAIYKKLHPDRPQGDLAEILAAVRRLLDVGYPAEQVLNSVTYTGMQTVDDMTATINFFEQTFRIATCINIYHTYLRPGQTMRELELFIPSKRDIARVYSHWQRRLEVEQMPMNCVNKQYCSATAAVLCDGSVTGCATIREPDAPNVNRDGSFYEIVNRHRSHLIFKRLKDQANLPDECRKCKITDTCWGCRSRSFAAGDGIYGKDPRCFRS